MVHCTSPEKTIGLKHIIRWNEFSSIPILHWYYMICILIYFFMQLRAAPGPFCTPRLNWPSPCMLGLDAEPDEYPKSRKLLRSCSCSRHER